MRIRRHPSPNHGARRGEARPSLVVLHYTAMESAAAACARLSDPVAEVSAHWLVDLDGTIWQLVDERHRAWHAGLGSWGGRGDVNSRSIGIELQNTGAHPFPEPQMRALEKLLGGILARWDIAPQGVIGHADMAPGRKADPGPRFDWRRLARAGLSVWPEEADAPGDEGPAPGREAAFVAALARFGYPCEAPPGALIAAFRARFRPAARGPLSRADLRVAQALALRFPVDGAGTDA